LTERRYAHGREWYVPKMGGGRSGRAEAIQRVAAEGISPEQAVDEAIAAIEHILGE
jgi:hypothetical protein